MFNMNNPYNQGFWALTIGTFLVGVGGMFLFSFWFLAVNVAYMAYMFFGGGINWFAKNSVDWDYANNTNGKETHVWTTPDTTETDANETTPSTPTQV